MSATGHNRRKRREHLQEIVGAEHFKKLESYQIEGAGKIRLYFDRLEVDLGLPEDLADRTRKKFVEAGEAPPDYEAEVQTLPEGAPTTDWKKNQIQTYLEQEGIEYGTSDTKKELVDRLEEPSDSGEEPEYPIEKGGGWWELSDGSSVQGEQNAIEKQAELD